MVIIDTSIVIDYLRQRGKPDTIFENLIKKLGRTNLAISILTVQELFAGKSIEDAINKEFLEGFLVSMNIFPYNLDIAKKAGEISRLLGKSVGFVDPGLAATAMVNGASLCTLNVKDFTGIKGLELYKI